MSATPRKTRAAKRKVVLARVGHINTKPQPKKKKPSPAPGATDRKSKVPAARRPALAQPAQPLPEFAAIERRPYLAPRRNYFLGGGTVSSLRIPEGFVLASDPHPGPDWRVSHLKVFRTEPEGQTVRMVKYQLKECIVVQIRAHAQRIRKEIAMDDGNARARKELALLIAKNRRNGQPTRLFYK
jgi:hypothetical protein